jgi:C4-dicarboxylate-specific signal transduction histidine kinase
LKKNRGRLGDVEVNSTVSDVVKLVRSNALRRGVTVDVELSPWMRPILGDRVQVQQVILNLLMNACDAVESNAKGMRRVGLKPVPRQDAMIIEVQDNGAGISDEELQHIFEPFYTTKHEGLGLGLAICQSIVAAHGGTLDAVRNPSGGMTFSVIFPIGQSTATSIGKSAAARPTGLSTE